MILFDCVLSWRLFIWTGPGNWRKAASLESRLWTPEAALNLELEASSPRKHTDRLVTNGRHGTMSLGPSSRFLAPWQERKAGLYGYCAHSRSRSRSGQAEVGGATTTTSHWKPKSKQTLTVSRLILIVAHNSRRLSVGELAEDQGRRGLDFIGSEGPPLARQLELAEEATARSLARRELHSGARVELARVAVDKSTRLATNSFRRTCNNNLRCQPGA